MSTVADELIVRYRLDDQVTPQAAKFVGSVQKTANATGIAANAAEGMGGSLAIVTAGLEAAEMAAKAYVAAMAAAGGLAYELSQEAAHFDSLERSLQAVEGSSRATERALKDLKQIAAAPGLGFEEALKSYTSLRNSGLGEDFSKEIIRQAANANALAGGNPESFSRVMLALGQISRNRFLQGDELNQLTENGIPANRLIKQAFGSSDTEELKKAGVTGQAVLAALTLEMQKQARVAGGDENAFTNLGDAISFAKVQAGDAVNEAFVPMANQLGEIVSLAADGGVFREIGSSLADLFSMDGSGFEGIFVNVAAALKTGIDYLDIVKEGLLDIVEVIAPSVADSLRGILADTGIGDMFESNRQIIEADMKLGRLRQKQDATSDRTFAGPMVDMLKKMAGERDDAMEATARNTAEMVRIEKDRYKLDQKIIGGGAFGTDAWNPVKVQEATRGTASRGGGKIERAIDLIRQAMREEAEEIASLSQRRLGFSPVMP